MNPGTGAHTVHVKLGPPLVAPGPRQAQALTDALMERIARLSGF